MSIRRCDICILLPVLNEIDNIDRLTKGIHSALQNRSFVVCFVDDGSRDGTREYLADLVKRSPENTHLITREKTWKGSARGGALHVALLWGLSCTDAHTFVEMDGDLSHKPSELPKGISEIESGRADVTIGSKYLDGSLVTDRPLGRRLVSLIANFGVRTLLTRKISDYSNGFRFYNRRAAESIRNHEITYASPIYLTEVMAIWLANSHRISEFPSHYVGRHEGLSKLRWIDLAKASLAVFEIAGRYHMRGFRPSNVECPSSR
jgi:dolichol-phosphate mannosyltransferase